MQGIEVGLAPCQSQDLTLDIPLGSCSTTHRGFQAVIATKERHTVRVLYQVQIPTAIFKHKM